MDRDIALLRPREDCYTSAFPRADDVLMIVEVSDSTLRFDRELKLPLYARSNIPEAWIVDLEHDVLIVCRDPAHDGYREIRTLPNPGSVSPGLLANCVVDLSGLF